MNFNLPTAGGRGWTGSVMQRAVAVVFVLMLCGIWPQRAQADPWILLGENVSGRRISADLGSLRAAPPIAGVRDFPTMQLLITMRGPGNKGSVEKVRYSFYCRARKTAALSYYRTLNGVKSHDWRGADINMKYHPVEQGGLVEMALTYACSGGKLPERRTLTLPSLEDEEAKEGEGG